MKIVVVDREAEQVAQSKDLDRVIQTVVEIVRKCGPSGIGVKGLQDHPDLKGSINLRRKAIAQAETRGLIVRPDTGKSRPYTVVDRPPSTSYGTKDWVSPYTRSSTVHRGRVHHSSTVRPPSTVDSDTTRMCSAR